MKYRNKVLIQSVVAIFMMVSFVLGFFFIDNPIYQTLCITLFVVSGVLFVGLLIFSLAVKPIDEPAVETYYEEPNNTDYEYDYDDDDEDEDDDEEEEEERLRQERQRQEDEKYWSHCNDEREDDWSHNYDNDEDNY